MTIFILDTIQFALIYRLIAKKYFENTGEKHIIHFMDLPVVFFPDF